MRPSLPHHSTTSLHRAPGGLRTLDLIVERISEFSDQNPDADVNVLVVGDEQANFAIPIAALGYHVVSLHLSETEAQKAQALSEELGAPILSKTTRLEEEASGKYDIIVFPRLASADAIAETCRLMPEKIKSHGTIIFGIHKDKNSYGEIRGKIASAHLRIHSSAGSCAIVSKLISNNSGRFKKGGALFHFLDSVDSFLSSILPRQRSCAWVFECRKKLSAKLAVFLLPTLAAGGGAERLVMQLAARMPDLGYEAQIIANVRGGGLEEPLRNQNIPFTILYRQGIFGRCKNIIRLKNILRDLEPDIVHTNLFAADFWGRIAARLAGRGNVVTTIHNVQNDYGKIGILIMRALKSFSKIYIAISNDVAEYMKGELGIAGNKIATIPNGIEIPGIVKRQNRPFHDVPRLLFVGRLEPQKNPDIFLRALAEVRNRFECSIYGEGSMEHELKRLADELGILPRIYWRGVVENINEVYAEHDIFILPSAWEGFGLVAVEAAVAGIPMIVSDLPVMRELFGEQHVKMVKPGNPEDLASAIQDVLNQPATAINRAQQLSMQDFSKYSIDKMASDYAELYDSLIKTKNASNV